MISKRLSFLLIGLFSQAASAGDFVSGRAGAAFGAWTAGFSQSGLGAKVSDRQSASPGGELTLGLEFATLVFVEYQLSYFPTLGNSPTRATYSSFWGFNLGVDVPNFPMEFYLGTESGNYDFAAASQFSGRAFKAGAILNLGTPANFKYSLVGEYRRLGISSDQAGDLPFDFTTRSDIYFVGLKIQLAKSGSK
jgi:hypothetical protein